MMFKVCNGETPEYIRSLFTRSTGRYGSNNFIPPRPRIDLYKTSLAFLGSSVWNSLPSFLKILRTIRRFKMHLQTQLHLISQPCQLYVILNTQEIKRTLSNNTEQDKTCKFSMWSSFSSYVQHNRKQLNQLIFVRWVPKRRVCVCVCVCVCICR